MPCCASCCPMPVLQEQLHQQHPWPMDGAVAISMGDAGALPDTHSS